MERFGLVGLPNAGKCSLYNALTGGGALAAPYAFATKDPNIGVAKVPDERLDRLAEMSQVAERRPRRGAGRRHRRPRRGRQQGRGPRQQVPRQHPRGRRHRVRAAGVRRRRRRRARPIRSSTCASSRSSSPSPTSRRSRSGSHQAAAPGQARQVARRRGRRAAGGLRRARGRPPALPRRPQGRRTASCWRPYFLLTNKPVLAVVNVGEDELDRIPEVEATRARPSSTSAGDNVEVIGMCVQLEAEAATIDDPDERAEMLEGFGLGEGALFRMVRTRLPPARAAHVPHHRREGDAGPGRSAPARRRRSAPGGSTPTSSAASSGRGHPLGRAARDRLVVRRPRRSASSASRARTTRSVDGDVMEFRFNV